MAYTFNGTKYLESNLASLSLSSTPMTMACWTRRNSNTNNIFVLNVGEKTANHRNQLAMTGAGVLAITQVGSTAASLFSGLTVQDQTWSHIAGIFSSLSSRTAYLNGSASGVDTTSIASMNSPTHIQIAARYSSGIATDFNGDIADVGIWNVALTAGEIASLSKGVACDKIRPGDLVFYAPLVRDLLDYSSGLTITNNNGATVSDHPRLYL